MTVSTGVDGIKAGDPSDARRRGGDCEKVLLVPACFYQPKTPTVCGGRFAGRRDELGRLTSLERPRFAVR